ncbi:MAG: hypothetical protein IJX28_08685 [Clostridia bacterium]|nr:hypothetical protein [Clostridia bacterium]
MKLFVKILCSLLALCTLAALAVGCTQSGGEGEGTKAPVANTGAQTNAATENLDENGYLKDALPEDLKFNQVVRIVVSESQAMNVYQTELSDNVISNAIFNRCATVEERLGIEIEWLPMDATWNANRNAFFSHIQSTSSSGDAYDAICVYNLIPGALAAKGLCENLAGTTYLDLTAPWWPEDFVDEIVVNDTLYSLVENSSRGTLYNIHGVFFNNSLIEDYHLTSPYDMVAANEWTFANMMALIKDTWSDQNDNGIKDKDDFFGVMTGTEAKIETWFYGMGYKYSTKNAEGEPELLMGDTNYMISWLDEFTKAAGTNDFLLWDENGHTKAFFENRAILYMSAIRLVDNGVAAGIEMDYGIVPVPKKDENQEKYITNVANTHDTWCVPLNAKSMDVSSAVLECMASESYRQVAPVYFDQCIKLRYAPDGRLAEMYDLIRNSIVFDFCGIYSFAFVQVPRTVLHMSAKTPQTYPWASQWATYGAKFEAGFAEILALYHGQTS